MNRFKCIFAGLVTTAVMCIAIPSSNLCAQLPAPNDRGSSTSKGVGLGEQKPIPSNAVGTCSNCLKTIRGRQVNLNSCPHCGVKWVNKTPTASTSSDLPTIPQAPWAGTGDSNAPTTMSLVILVILLGGIIFMMLISGVVFFVVKKSLEDNKKYGRRNSSNSYTRYRGS